MVIVTGATGQLGRDVVDGLLTRLPADQIVASVRDPEKATALAQRGVHVRVGNFAEPDRLTESFAGAVQVLVVSVDKLGDEARRLHRAAIEAARAAGAQRVLYTSHVGARADSPFAPASDHAAAEDVLAEGGAPFTSLRHGFYTESALHMVGHGIEAGEIRAPEDGPVSWTACADLAEADAIVLADEGRLDGITPPLTAPEAFTMTDLAAIASEITGRKVKDADRIARRIESGLTDGRSPAAQRAPRRGQRAGYTEQPTMRRPNRAVGCCGELARTQPRAIASLKA